MFCQCWIKKYQTEFHSYCKNIQILNFFLHSKPQHETANGKLPQ